MTTFLQLVTQTPFLLFLLHLSTKVQLCRMTVFDRKLLYGYKSLWELTAYNVNQSSN